MEVELSVSYTKAGDLVKSIMVKLEDGTTTSAFREIVLVALQKITAEMQTYIETDLTEG